MCADSIGVVEVRAKDTDDNTECVIYWYVDRIEKGIRKSREFRFGILKMFIIMCRMAMVISRKTHQKR